MVRISHVLSVALVGLAACLIPNSDCEWTATCQGSGTADGGTDAGADGAVVATCDPAKDASCVSDAKGVFVQAGAAGDGTMAAPFGKVQDGIDKAKREGKTVFVCEGTYPEAITLSASLYGGFDCSWKSANVKPVLSAVGPVVRIGASMGLMLANVAIDAKVGNGAGAHAFGIFIANANAVELVGIDVRTADGSEGEPGKTVNYTYPDPMDMKGKNGDDAVAPGAGGKATCPSGENSEGGKGGPIGSPGLAGNPSVNGGTAGTLSLCEMSSIGGGQGGIGQVGGNADPAVAPCAITESEFRGTEGSKGKFGAPGGGGGGGGFMGAGGGGGAGGCGGAGGGGGGAGGSSVAIVSYQSTVEIVDAKLTTGAGKGGGAGASGQAGQDGAFKGNGSGGACQGGGGGKGGAGGAGSGGAGGLSVGVVYKGSAPVFTGGLVTNGARGEGGKGPGKPGPDGVSAKVYEVP